ncbi:hypothetical protein CCU68_22565 [Pseudomonas gingeri NCPPB 3146 = LMG 5327]|uniref:Uncharacterized protein n=2 Tax=Pseudomonas gingeri TaxID=117681 RepID=A0A7Y8CD04_9PSED|nr:MULTISPECIES: hypothetical protein [Pseudomonas]NVZ24408.1 hypothetical protein [Pseudomonas gingeri]NVZ66954.1 hypothetical protein [Pseudomonas gingeri]NVZ79818.1 hypothetical protein [Pseudomonas gingeri]NWA11390.1 hypothetical protein [Pseudomonas gingeri]NWC13527.1 hypothetical protein [Pseudomonas gingeri]
MAVNPIEGGGTPPVDAKSKFDAAVDKAADSSSDDQKITDFMVQGAIQIGGQFIIMPRLNELLNDAMADDDGDE